MTLMRFIKKANATCTVGIQSTFFGNQILPAAVEKDPASHIVFLADMYFDLLVEKCKELAFRFAIENKMPVPESWERDRKAGKQWWKSLKNRHHLSIKKPEATLC